MELALGTNCRQGIPFDARASDVEGFGDGESAQESQVHLQQQRQKEACDEQQTGSRTRTRWWRGGGGGGGGELPRA